MVDAFVNSSAAFRALLAIPAAALLARLLFLSGGWGHFIAGSGEWAARLLIVTLAITPLRMLFRGQHWPMWLFKRRRDLGIAAFLYALLHLGAYLLHYGSIAFYLGDLQNLSIVLGWLALAAMLVAFSISNDWALRRLGVWWKPFERVVYVAAAAAFLHWLWLARDDGPALLHFAPLAALEAYRVIYNFARPGRRHTPGRGRDR